MGHKWEQQKKHLAERKARGLCRQCTKSIWSGSSTYCKDHYDKHKERCKKSAAKQKAKLAQQFSETQL